LTSVGTHEPELHTQNQFSNWDWGATFDWRNWLAWKDL